MTGQPPAFRGPYRRRRIIWTLLLVSVVSLWYLATHTETSFGSWSLPQYLKDIGLSSSSSPARLVSDAKAEAGRVRVDEIQGVLHFVTAYPDRTLNEVDGGINVEGLGLVEVDPHKEVDLRVYAPDGNDNWTEHLEELQTKHPLIVFSKSYCPYSQRAKALLTSQQLSPSPTVVELDQRADGAILQAILKRLTGRGTVPNVILQGKSIGGSDDIMAMHQDNKLKPLLHENGLLIGGV